MSSPTTSRPIRSAISSPVSVGGHSLSERPVGPTTDLFGQVLAHANHSVPQVSRKASTTPATYGRNSSGSLRSDYLQSSLESRLRARLHGSPSCEVIWTKWVTPWGQSRSKPRARVRTISEIAFGLWPTMTSNAPAKDGNNEAGNSAGQVAIRKIILGLWSTLRASDGAKGGPNMSFGAGGSPLPSQVSTVGNLSNAPMENGGGSLHPEFAGWELGFPPEWLSCAPLAMQSTGALRRK